jgi:hypothetical protein
VRPVWRGVLDCSASCVERCAGMQCVLCGEVCWTAVRPVWRGMLDPFTLIFVLVDVVGEQGTSALPPMTVFRFRGQFSHNPSARSHD